MSSEGSSMYREKIKRVVERIPPLKAHSLECSEERRYERRVSGLSTKCVV